MRHLFRTIKKREKQQPKQIIDLFFFSQYPLKLIKGYFYNKIKSG